MTNLKEAASAAAQQPRTAGVKTVPDIICPLRRLTQGAVPGLIVSDKSAGRWTFGRSDKVATTCSKCGAKKSLMDALMADLAADVYVCQPCQERIKQAAVEAEEKRVDQIKRAASKVIVTTTPEVDGTRVVAYLGIESVEYVIGTAIFSEVTTELADLFGQRSTAFEKKLQQAKINAMGVLKFRAAEKGANAVIGIDMDYTEFSGNRVALIINGTLVKVATITPRPVVKQALPEV